MIVTNRIAVLARQVLQQVQGKPEKATVYALAQKVVEEGKYPGEWADRITYRVWHCLNRKEA